MDAKAIDELFEDVTKRRALILGDVMVDAYLWGRVDRISPEAPVPIIRVTEREDRLGGAANVALNVAAMGAEPVICAVVGEDGGGETFRNLLAKRGISDRGLIGIRDRPTTTKTRVISGHQHIVRVDEESDAEVDEAGEELLMARISDLMENYTPDVVIFEDYNKGVLTENVISHALDLARSMGIPTAVDPKKHNFFAYRGATLFKPNLKELAEGLKLEITRGDLDSIRKAVNLLESKIENDISLITLSEKGMFVQQGERRHHIPAHVRNIADVSGAGDTVISVAALALASGVDVRDMAALSNLAGGLVCEHVGVVPIDRERLRAEAHIHLAGE